MTIIPEGFFDRVAMGHSHAARIVGRVAFVASVIFAAFLLWNLFVLGSITTNGVVIGVARAALLLIFAWDVLLFATGRPVAFWVMEITATRETTPARWVSFFFDIFIICALVSF